MAGSGILTGTVVCSLDLAITLRYGFTIIAVLARKQRRPRLLEVDGDEWDTGPFRNSPVCLSSFNYSLLGSRDNAVQQRCSEGK